MSKPVLPNASLSKASCISDNFVANTNSLKRNQRNEENSDVLISAVISPYLLTHLHHVLQRAEYGAKQDGKVSLATNFAQLRKVLCMDARSMKDASAAGVRESNTEKFNDSFIEPKAA